LLPNGQMLESIAQSESVIEPCVIFPYQHLNVLSSGRQSGGKVGGFGHDECERSARMRSLAISSCGNEGVDYFARGGGRCEI
jgi:hypothetical protein